MLLLSCKNLRFYITSALVSLLLILILILIIQNAPRAAVDSAANPAESTASFREFLYAFGWETDPVPEEETVLIPAQFNKVYSTYNELQKAQGYDLSPYRGKNAEKYVFRILNYPGTPGSEAYVRATVLVYEGQVIGGDVCSVQMDGFMHGFMYEAE